MSEQEKLSPEQVLCTKCGGKGVVPVCCECPVHDPYTLSGYICCGNYDRDACDQCDAWQKVYADE